jgi:hypothetical protein
VREGAQSGGLRVAPAPRTAEEVTLAIGEGERRVELKVGESVNRDTGEVRDLLGDGMVGVSTATGSQTSGGTQR